MKAIITSSPGSNPTQRLLDKQQAANQIRVRGSAGLPEAPRDLQIQPANGGIQVSWKLPVNHARVAGWRVYLNTESNLSQQIRDKGTRQVFIPLGSGATPATVNVMVSSFTTLGRESTKVVSQGSPLSQTGTTQVPSAPPGYLKESAGGANRQLIRFQGESQYIR